MSRPFKLVACINYRPNEAAPSCAARGSEKLIDTIETEVRRRGIRISVERIRCLGQCQNGPTMRLVPGGKFYLGVKESDIEPILNEIESLCGTDESAENDDTGSFPLIAPGC